MINLFRDLLLQLLFSLVLILFSIVLAPIPKYYGGNFRTQLLIASIGVKMVAIHWVSIVLDCAGMIYEVSFYPRMRSVTVVYLPWPLCHYDLSLETVSNNWISIVLICAAFSIVLSSFPRFGHLLPVYTHEVSNQNSSPWPFLIRISFQNFQCNEISGSELANEFIQKF